MLENVLAGGLVSKGLTAGVHENVRLVSIDPKLRKDKNENIINKQLFVKFVKYTEDDEVLGEREISFFMLDPERDFVVSNLADYLLELRSILGLFYTKEEIDEKFNVLDVLINEEWSEDEVTAFFDYDNIGSKVLTKDSQYKKLQQNIRDTFWDILKDNIGYESDFVRLKLVTDDTGEYVQIPKNVTFVERSTVSKESSRLY